MIKEILTRIDATVSAEAALLLFFVVFIAVSWRAITMSRSASERRANMPLEDGVRRNGHA